MEGFIVGLIIGYLIGAFAMWLYTKEHKGE